MHPLNSKDLNPSVSSSEEEKGPSSSLILHCICFSYKEPPMVLLVLIYIYKDPHSSTIKKKPSCCALMPVSKHLRYSQQDNLDGGESFSLWGCWYLPHFPQSLDGSIVWFLGGPMWSLEEDMVVLIGPFQHGVFCDSVIILCDGLIHGC